jgi:hypothetical protein
LEPRKAAATVVITDELGRLAGASGDALIRTELRNAVVAATDNAFLTALIATTTPTASSGDVLADLATLLAASGAGAQFFSLLSHRLPKICLSFLVLLVPPSPASHRTLE